MYSDPRFQRAASRHGGLLPMHLTDGDTGKTVYDNRDATAMAKQFVARGGHASDASISNLDKWLALMEEKYFMTETQCQHCKAKVKHYHEIVFEKGFVCWSCWKDNPKLETTPEYLEQVRNTYPWVDKLISLHYNNKEGRRQVIEDFLNSLGPEQVVAEENNASAD